MRKPASGKAKCHAMLTPTNRDLNFFRYTRLSDIVIMLCSRKNYTKHLKISNKNENDYKFLPQK